MRFRLWLCCALWALAGTQAARADTDSGPLAIGITSVFLVDQDDFLAHWKTYLERKLERPVRFVRRKSYTEITDMLLSGQLDAAWICTFSYVFNRANLRLIATPVFRGEPYYRSYLIVSSRDQTTQGYEHLRGKVFAYVEPRSNTGYLYPRFALKRLGQNPDAYFRDTFFTWSHPDVVAAVSEGLADAGAVDGYIWEVLRVRQPELTARTRLVSQSTQFGFPPVVAGALLDDELLAKLRALLLGMHEDAEGRRLLDRLYLDRFIDAGDTIYDGIPAIMEAVFTPGEGE